MIYETLVYRALGLKKESSEISPLSVAAITLKSMWHTWSHGTIIEGAPIPSEGPVIATGNHRKKSDIDKAVQAVRILGGRWIIPLIKKILTDEGAVESDEYLASIGTTKEEALKDYKPLQARIIRGSGAISALRDTPSATVGRACLRVLNRNQVLGLFLQPHRYEDTTLQSLQDSAATLAQRKPDVPVSLFAMSGKPEAPEDKVTVFPPVTYNQLRQEYGRDLTPAELTIIFADMIVTALPESSQIDWAHRWSEELTRLNKEASKRNRAA